MSVRAHQARLLGRPLARAIHWLPLPAAAALAIGVLTPEGDILFQLRLAAIALCVGAAFVLDDPAAETTASSPMPLLGRRLVRVALVLPVVAALWLLLLRYAGAAFSGAVTLELAAMLAVTLATAALAAPFVADGRGGVVAAPALPGLLAAAALTLPEDWTLFAEGPDDPRWAPSHGRWAVLLVIATLLFLYASLDPGRARLSSRLRDRNQAPLEKPARS